MGATEGLGFVAFWGRGVGLKEGEGEEELATASSSILESGGNSGSLPKNPQSVPRTSSRRPPCVIPKALLQAPSQAPEGSTFFEGEGRRMPPKVRDAVMVRVREGVGEKEGVPEVVSEGTATGALLVGVPLGVGEPVMEGVPEGLDREKNVLDAEGVTVGLAEALGVNGLGMGRRLGEILKDALFHGAVPLALSTLDPLGLLLFWNDQ